MRRPLVPALALSALLVIVTVHAAPARDPGRWRATGRSPIPTTWYQGITSDDRGGLFFSGTVAGLHRADSRLRQRGGTDAVIPPEVTAAEGYNHVGDLSWDAAEGGRVLLPLECYDPGAANEGNTCATGAIAVASPRTLRWRYYVKLDPAEIAKAMWAEVSPDGTLVWTSSGTDLLAYRAAEIAPARAAPVGPPLRAVRRLPGALPRAKVTGAAFFGDRLLLASQAGRRFQVWSVDLVTGARRLEIDRRLVGESEGLDVVRARGGVLHWIVTPFAADGGLPTYRSNVLLHFVPSARASRPVLRLRARPRRLVAGVPTPVRFAVTVRDRAGRRPAAGALIRVAGRRLRTDSTGAASTTLRLSRRGAHVARATRDDARAAAVALRVVRPRRL